MLDLAAFSWGLENPKVVEGTDWYQAATAAVVGLTVNAALGGRPGEWMWPSQEQAEAVVLFEFHKHSRPMEWQESGSPLG